MIHDGDQDIGGPAGRIPGHQGIRKLAVICSLMFCSSDTLPADLLII
jgi:hypothetical protein